MFKLFLCISVLSLMRESMLRNSICSGILEVLREYLVTWCLLYKPGICVFTFYDYDIFNFFVFLYSKMIGREKLLICRALERFNRELNN